MLNFTFKPLMLALGLSLFSANIFAHSIESDRTVLNRNDRATVTAKFQTPLSGDLYVATVIGGKLLFITDQGTKLNSTPLPFQTGIFDGNLKLLDVVALNIDPGVYPLYEVVVVSGKDPLNFLNWVGGLGGLNQLSFKIGLNPSSSNTDNKGNSSCDDSFSSRKREDDDHKENDNDDDSPRVTPTVANNASNCVPVNTNTNTNNTPSPNTNLTPTPNNTPTPNVALGQSLYRSLDCATGGCHQINPALNKNRVLKGKVASEIRAAINTVSDMNYLKDTSDTDLQAIAAYLSTF